MNMKKVLSTLAPAALGLLAFIFALFLPGAALNTTEQGAEVVTTVGMLGMFFGAPNIVANSKVMGAEMKIEMSAKGGMAIFGLLAFLLLLAGVALLVFAFLKENKTFKLVGNGLLALSGVLIFFLLTVGTNVTAMTIAGESIEAIEPVTFKDFYDELKLGAGAIIWGILTILGGGLGLFMTVKED